MAIHRALGRRRRYGGLPTVAWMSFSGTFVMPLVLVIAGALGGWLLYGRISPTVDNKGATRPVAQPDLPQSASEPAGTPRAAH